MELLAPAGDIDCLEAAIEAGADAVYFGLSLLNARRGAKNLSPNELARAVETARRNRVATRLAVNVDISGREIGTAARMLSLARDAGVDAVIVRDWAAIAIWRAMTGADRPALHLSTQAAITNMEGARLAREMGASRMVLAREFSLAEIREIASAPGLELEVFAQGALCYSVSGRCLMSSWGGGRSGNRGLCASPCRVPWAINDEAVGSAMSMRDLAVIDRLADLRAAGVAALKIEGRLKNPRWIREAVGLYREALGPRDDPSPCPAPVAADALSRARRLGSYAGRDSTSGYLDGRFSLLTGLSARKSGPAASEAVREFLDELGGPGSAAGENRGGYSLEISVAPKGLSCRCRYAGRSQNWHMPKTRIRREARAVTVAALFARLAAEPIGRASLEESYSNEPELMLPPRNVKTVTSLVSAFINRLDGAADDGADLLLKAPLPPELRLVLAAPEPHPANRRRLGELPTQVRLTARQFTPSLSAALRNAEIVLAGARADGLDAVGKFADPARTIISFPEVYFPNETAAMRDLARACRDGGFQAEANCWGSLWLCREAGLPFTAGPGLAILNPLAAKFLLGLGAAGAVVSIEADRRQIEDICRSSPLPLTLIIYGRPVLAYTRIPKDSLLAGRGGSADGVWTDRRGISLSPEAGGSVTAFRSLAPFDWKCLRNDAVRASHLSLDLSGEPSPLDVWNRFHRPGGKPGFLFNYNRGLK